MRNKHKGQRCFVIASGPSIKKMDLAWLKDEITICVNESYQAIPFDPTYICIGDKKLWPLIKDKYVNKKSLIICGSGLNGLVGRDYEGENLKAVYKLDVTKQVPRDGFNWDLRKPLRIAWNVIPEVVIPFVCWAGFKECFLLGCDCTNAGYFYQHSVTNTQKFDDRAMLSNIEISKQVLPTIIYNATIGGNLNCYPRVDFDRIKKGLSGVPNRKLMVVGYYTNERNYKELAEGMRASVENHGLSCDIQEMPSLAAKHPDRRPPMPWVLNCSLCASFIQQMRRKHPEHDLLYLDADALMLRRPKLFLDFPRDYDFAAPFYTIPGKVINQLSSNTLYFAATQKADALLSLWKREQQKRNKAMLQGAFVSPFKTAWDQQVLQDVLPLVSELRWAELPWEYAKPTNTPLGEELLPETDPNKIVILQQQASRENKMEQYNGTH